MRNLVVTVLCREDAVLKQKEMLLKNLAVDGHGVGQMSKEYRWEFVKSPEARWVQLL